MKPLLLLLLLTGCGLGNQNVDVRKEPIRYDTVSVKVDTANTQKSIQSQPAPRMIYPEFK